MRNKIVDMFESGKEFKAISKALGLQRTTVRTIIHKWRKLGTVVNLPRTGRPTKITQRLQRWLIQEIIKEPRITSKQLQVSLASIKVSVHDSTIRKRLGKNSIHGRVPRQKALLTHILLKETVQPSVCDLKLKRSWVILQDNDPKHQLVHLKNNRIKVLDWPNQVQN